MPTQSQMAANHAAMLAPQPFASIAAFKRAMQPGTEWVTLHEYLDENNQPQSAPKDMGVRVCGLNNSVDFGFHSESGRISHSAWPKASEFASPAPGVAVITKAGFCRLTYSLVKGA